jgi:hypothetical protein
MRVYTIPLLFFAFASWAVFLGGLASVQNICNDGTTGAATLAERGGGAGATSTGLSGVFGFSNNLSCSQLYRFWYGVFC